MKNKVWAILVLSVIFIAAGGVAGLVVAVFVAAAILSSKEQEA